ncbi:MAG: preprotein translocase subunit SecA [Candidatus Tokpelaia sp. JSC161]|nr:MAG: preprotein translocase subunit SecA [Candidatus Tokpelaia sp. JSC161]
MITLSGLARKFLRSTHERYIKTLRPIIAEINTLENQFLSSSDEQLRSKTYEFRKRIDNGEPLDSLMTEAFAVVREAAKRVLGMRPFDVQLIGSLVLHKGGIAEMRTGEGKTLMATLPVYLNALEGKGVHVVTVNDYLASRDAESMGKLYAFLGLTTGVIINNMNHHERRSAYLCDITYATNNELGFDYLRDNMALEPQEMVQRGHHYAIIDEVDSILIDEARTPLIISGALEDRSHFYNQMNTIIPSLSKNDFEIDEKQKTATFTESGTEKIEKLLSQRGELKAKNLYEIENITILHHLNNALRAHKLFQRDRDYIIRNNEIIIIDEFTGRMMPGRRYSEGLHQALEAKEMVPIQAENQTLTSITFQNYFRMYTKLSGMTGTATTEAEEFDTIYNLNVTEIPTNLPVKRLDEDDEIYRTEEEKYKAIIRDIHQALSKKQPVLVGTTSIEKSEKLAERLRKEKIHTFQVLNARYHEQEAYIIAQAGVPGTLTIATNMAGRGTDIQLGGNIEMRIKRELKNVADGPERQSRIEAIRKDVASLKKQALAGGGLYVLATERHESRRIDNQLRGRSGRQGDPGRSKFFLSLEDDLMRIFGSQRVEGLLQKLGLKENEAIIHPWINKALEKAQKKVESRNFEIRKNLLKYDDVMNNQRTVIFEQRMEIMKSTDLNEIIDEMRDEVIQTLVEIYFPPNSYNEKWNPQGLQNDLYQLFKLEQPVTDWVQEDDIEEEKVLNRIRSAMKEQSIKKTEQFGHQMMTYFQKMILLETIDTLWRDHLYNLENLRSAVSFRGYAQRDPLNEYKTESFELFQSMLVNLRREVISKLMSFELIEKPIFQESSIHDQKKKEDMIRWKSKIRRNAPCPCQSGKKYKHCHGTFS